MKFDLILICLFAQPSRAPMMITYMRLNLFLICFPLLRCSGGKIRQAQMELAAPQEAHMSTRVEALRINVALTVDNNCGAAGSWNLPADGSHGDEATPEAQSMAFTVRYFIIRYRYNMSNWSVMTCCHGHQDMG